MQNRNTRDGIDERQEIGGEQRRSERNDDERRSIRTHAPNKSRRPTGVVALMSPALCYLEAKK